VLVSPLSHKADEIDIAWIPLGDVSFFFLGAFDSHFFLAATALFALGFHFFDAEAGLIGS
jgi:hypothetical protein